MNTAHLKAKLATIFHSPKLDLKVEQIDSAGKRQQITAADNLSLTVKRVANQWKTVASSSILLRIEFAKVMPIMPAIIIFIIALISDPFSSNDSC